MILSEESFPASWQKLVYLLSNHPRKIAPGSLRTNSLYTPDVSCSSLLWLSPSMVALSVLSH